MLKIEVFTSNYQDLVIEHILNIENDEFKLNLTLDEQPDLIDIRSSYQSAGGQFWVAVEKSLVLGTIGLFNLGNGDADLRKMFVTSTHRGGSEKLGQQLLDTAMVWARKQNYQRIFLETSSTFAAAIRFYEKNGFKSITQEELPASFPIIRVAEYFYLNDLSFNLNEK